jgi:dienelactone hydrolase
MTGFRCIKPIAPGPQDALLERQIASKPRPDWSAMKGFSDDAWRTWQGLLSYTKGPLDGKSEWIDDSSPSWRMEKVTFNAAYDNERVVAYLFLPKNVPPPYQTVIFMQPGYGVFVNSSQDGRNTQDMSYWDYLVKDGRAVVYLIYKGIYERGGGGPISDSTSLVWWVKPAKDVFRTVDYLETRQEFRTDRLAYLGTSAAGDAGTMICAMEKRFKAAVFQGAGLAGVEPFDREEIGFAHRCTTAVQMINGAFDGYGQRPVFDALAASPDGKRHKTFPSDHSLAGFEKDVKRVNLEWFDKFLGPVR